MNQRKFLSGYRVLALRALLLRAVASVRRRGLVPTARVALLRYLPRKRALLPPELHDDMPASPVMDFHCANPLASIVIPVHNHWDFTLRCLYSLQRCLEASAHEVIVVDDASSDGTAEELARIPGLVVVRNDANLGFIGTCNAGAAAARGRYLVFLNNDTIVQPGWLDSLLATFRMHPRAGLAGSRLVFPDGSLQEAGGVVFSDGSAANYGRGEDPSHPNFGFVRRADYCSGAALCIPAALFASLGGFDRRYAPAYYEDTDLAMRVREAGLEVRYQPESVVVHFEGVTGGTDIATGVKAHQRINAGVFAERWRAVLQREHPAPRNDASELQRIGDANYRARPRVLVLDALTPTPDRDSGSLRMFELLRLLVEEGCAVTFLDQLHEHRGEYTRQLLLAGVETWWRPWVGDLPRWLRRHGPRFDAIVVSRHYVLSPVLGLLRKLAPQAQIVFDTVDLHFLREQREAERSGDERTRRAADRSRRQELALIAGADRTWVVSPVERELLASLAPAATVDVVSNIHEAVTDTPGREQRAGLAFVGSFGHAPNTDAALWLATEILPRVRERLPEVQLHLVGAEPPPELQALAATPGLRLHGHVADLDALLDRCLVSVAPLRFGAGVKGKVNQALARGLPVVATACAAEGMELQDGREVLLADDAEGFAAAIVRLHEDAALWRSLREAGFVNTRRLFSREVARATLRPWLDSLCTR
jgi:GT2 family glycosyltransferase/glycosyltransferase involved in cell wall biosynthesis